MLGTSTGAATSLLLFALLFPIEGIAGPYEDGDSAFQQKDYTTAMQHWRPLAADGHAGAQLGVATLYYGGLGVVQDYAQAFTWCTKSANQGDAKAKYILGAMYRDGKGVDKNLSLAMDRKSTRLNSSHLGISYAVFCLKKKKNNISN